MNTDFATPATLDVHLLWLPEALHGTLFSALDVLRVAAGILHMRNPDLPPQLTWKFVTPEGDAAALPAAMNAAYASAPPQHSSPARTLIVVPALFIFNAPEAMIVAERHPEVLRMLGEHMQQGGLLAATSNGLVFPARLGVLNGLTVNAPWMYKSFFVSRFPAADFSSDESIALHDKLYTCVAATQQMEFIAAILGRLIDEALEQSLLQVMQYQPLRQQIGHDLVLQDGLGKTADSPVFRATQWLRANLEQPYRLSVLAEVAATSERTLLRHFKLAVGMTPLEYLHGLRVERAKIMLEASLNDLHTVATACGYGDTSSFRRIFQQQTGMNPGEYRSRYTLRARRQFWRVETVKQKTKK